jgi:1-acyl-sn-glycerol-3-phosphate acyltransferase
MTPAFLALAITLWLLWSAFCAWCYANPRGEFTAGVLYRLIQIYALAVHRLRVRGREHLHRRSGPLIVVANHTSGVDPLLIQAASHFEIRWMMARDMMVPAGRALWEFARIIPVDRERGDSAALREAIRHLRQGGVLGVFPEGGIERPPGVLRPFEPGLGLIIARTRAPVLPVIIRGTPYATTAWESLFRSSRARLEVHPPIDAATLPDTPAAIVADLESRFRVWLREDTWTRER